MKNHEQYLNLLKQHKNRLLNIMGVCCAVSLSLYFVLPKNYKVSTSIALQTQYFQLPLVSGFMPETLDPQEMRSKREALMHLALNQKFLTEIATRYNLVKDPAKSEEIELFSKKFEVIPDGPSSFVVNFNAKDPNVAYQVLQDFLNHLQTVMTNERRLVLLNLHDAIQEQLESISVTKPGENVNAIYSARPDLVHRRIEKIQEEIDTLKNAYSERHPRITALKEQLAQLTALDRPTSESTTPRGDLLAGIQVDASSKDLFDDLIKKYRYLEVVMFMDQQNKDHYLSYLKEPYVPHAATWPKLPLLLAWGLAMGFLLGAVSVFLKAFPRTAANRLSVVNNENEVTIIEGKA